MISDQEIIDKASSIHNRLWPEEDLDQPKGNSLAKEIHDLWQNHCRGYTGIEVEYRTSDINGQKLDVFNKLSKSAFELKVSGKNLNHEVYKDICKAATHNLTYPENKIARLYFISVRKYIDALNRNFSILLKDSFKVNYGVEIKFQSIDQIVV